MVFLDWEHDPSQNCADIETCTQKEQGILMKEIHKVNLQMV